MTDKPENPLASEILQARKPRLNVALPPRRVLPDDIVEAGSRAIGEKWGANTRIVPVPPAEPVEPAAPLVSVRFDCPDYLDRAISVDAAQENVTKTFMILRALQKAGYEIKNVDLVKDRRRSKR
jgi:hypothetical protein